jgi:5-carboxymethyl-2-hydroxymuconate isomerase
MLNLCGIVATILKMATGRYFSMSGNNSGHHYLPTYQILMISDNVEFVRIVVAILKMVTGRNFSMSGINSRHHNLPTYEMSL